jgi:hypothetical protein
MTINVTTRQVLHMLKEAYKIGAMEEINGENLEGRADIIAQQLLMKNLWSNDFILQQA